MSSDNQKLLKAKSFVQTFLSSFTELSLPQLQEYLTQLEKQISEHTNEVLEGVHSMTELMNTIFQGKHKNCLHFCAARGDLSNFKYVIETYHPDLTLKDSQHRSPFLTAVAHNHLGLVTYLVQECGQNVNQTTEGGVGALHIASNINAIQVVKYLLQKGANIEQSSDFATPLNWAVGSNSTETALELLERGANPDGDLSTPFPPPLIIAIDFNNQKVYNKLIEKGASLEVYDPKGYSVLQLASEKGNLPLVQFLIQNGANVHYLCEEKSAFYLAFESNQWHVVDFLRKYEPEYQAVQEKVKAAKVAAATPITEQSIKNANLIKEEGNKFFAQGEFKTSISKYSEAIKMDPNNHILYSNRAASELALSLFEEALVDAARAKEICPTHTKSIYREAQAYAGLKNYVEAAASYWQALRLEPDNKELMSNFKKYVDLAKNKH